MVRLLQPRSTTRRNPAFEATVYLPRPTFLILGLYNKHVKQLGSGAATQPAR
jgi:hypothetical protein